MSWKQQRMSLIVIKDKLEQFELDAEDKKNDCSLLLRRRVFWARYQLCQLIELIDQRELTELVSPEKFDQILSPANGLGLVRMTNRDVRNEDFALELAKSFLELAASPYRQMQKLFQPAVAALLFLISLGTLDRAVRELDINVTRGFRPNAVQVQAIGYSDASQFDAPLIVEIETCYHEADVKGEMWNDKLGKLRTDLIDLRYLHNMIQAEEKTAKNWPESSYQKWNELKGMTDPWSAAHEIWFAHLQGRQIEALHSGRL